MLKYGTPNERKTNLNFDLKSLARASGLLLGKTKTKDYLKFASTKSLLKWFGELEVAAKHVLKNRNADFPADLESKSSKESLMAERAELAHSILNLENLPIDIESSELESLIRIRSKNQYDSINKSSVESIKNRDGATEVLIRVSLNDLQGFVNQGESSGYGKLKVEVTEEEEDYIKTQLKKGDVQFLFRDELTHRPEPKRISQGNKLKAILRDARVTKKTPKDIAKEQSALFTGTGITLSRSAKITEITEVSREKNIVTLEITSLLPEVRDAINKDPKGNAGKGAITDRGLRQHCSNEYGCNGRDFVAASKSITDALNKNLSAATKTWHGKETITQGDIEEFLNEYYTLTVCLDKGLTSINKMEDFRTIIKNTDELVPSRNLEVISNTQDPETTYANEAIGQESPNNPAAASLLAGEEWLGALKEQKIAMSTSSPGAKEYISYLEKIFGVKDASRKIALIQENYYRVPSARRDEKVTFGSIDCLDGGPSSIVMVAPHLSNQLIEKFEEERERLDNEIFNSKSDELKDYSGMQRQVIDDKDIGVTRTINSPAKKKEIIDKAEFIRRQKKIALELPYRGEVLRRLTKYPYRSSGLDFHRSAAEKFDEEISLAPKPRRSTPKMANGNMIRLEDCLTLEGNQDLKQKSKEEDYIKEITRLKSVVESWQTSHPITPTSKNPIDRNIHRWLLAISSGQVNEKANSLDELSQVINAIVSSGGEIPYDNEKGVERFPTPLRSSSIPLMLLCGTGFDKLAKTKNKEVEMEIEETELEDSAKGFDLILRWSNAENLNRLPLKYTEESYINELNNIVESDMDEEEREQALIEHATSIELSQLPNFKSTYLSSIGTDENLSEVKEENYHYKDLILPLSSSPLMMNLGGEEAPIDEVLSLLKENNLEIELSEAELEKIEFAPDIALENWRKSLQKTIDQIDQFFMAKQRDVSLDIFLSETKDLESEEDPFVKAITELHEAMPTAADDLKLLTTQLLAHNPQKITLNTQDGQIVLTKGSQEVWTTKAPEGESQKALELVNKAQEMINSKQLDPEDQLMVQECQKEAEKIILFENIERLGPALTLLPQSISRVSNIRETNEPLTMMTKQLEKAKGASNFGIKMLESMEEEREDPENPWGHGQSVLSPRGSIEYICSKITQQETAQFDAEGNKLPEEKTASYFSRQLLTQENKDKAVEILKGSGTKAAASYLKGEIRSNTEQIIEQAAQSLPEMVRDIKSALSAMIEHSHTEQAQEAIGKSGSIARIIQDKFKGRLLEKKINGLIDQARSEKREGVGVLDKLISNRALRNGVAIKVLGDEIGVDKLWAKSWLNTPLGKENLSKRINTAKWITSLRGTANARTAVAFLEFCHHRNLSSVTEAINKGLHGENDTKILKESVAEFSRGLETLGINTQLCSLKTQLLGAASLNALARGRKQSKLWNREKEEQLKNIKPTAELKHSDITPKFQYIIEGSKSIASPYLKANLERGGLDLESDIDNADPKTKLRTVKRAMAALYQAVPLVTKTSPKFTPLKKGVNKPQEVAI